jgi:hypothetical protein
MVHAVQCVLPSAVYAECRYISLTPVLLLALLDTLLFP